MARRRRCELVFEPVDIIPACWPKHPHIVHELAVLADHRRRAENADDSDFLEEWHRYSPRIGFGVLTVVSTGMLICSSYK